MLAQVELRTIRDETQSVTNKQGLMAHEQARMKKEVADAQAKAKRAEAMAAANEERFHMCAGPYTSRLFVSRRSE